MSLATIASLGYSLLAPTNVIGMIAVSVGVQIVYAPTIALVWAIFADVADYSEWQTGRRFTGMVFATIGFMLKSGLALGSASLLWLLQGWFDYDTKLPAAPGAVAGYRMLSGYGVAAMFAVCTVLLLFYKLDKRATIEMADELAARRAKTAAT